MTWRRPAAALAVACVMGLSACGGGGAGEDPAATRSAGEGGNAEIGRASLRDRVMYGRGRTRGSPDN